MIQFKVATLKPKIEKKNIKDCFGWLTVSLPKENAKVKYYTIEVNDRLVSTLGIKELPTKLSINDGYDEQGEWIYGKFLSVAEENSDSPKLSKSLTLNDSKSSKILAAYAGYKLEELKEKLHFVALLIEGYEQTVYLKFVTLEQFNEYKLHPEESFTYPFSKQDVETFKQIDVEAIINDANQLENIE